MSQLLRSEIQLRVRYAETDRMGYVYYGNYAQYLEVARVEMLRNLGHPYQQLEEDGILLPVKDFHIEYHSPAHYDDLLDIETVISECTGVRIVFQYKVINQKEEHICTASTTLVFVDAESGRPRKAPEELRKLLVIDQD